MLVSVFRVLRYVYIYIFHAIRKRPLTRHREQGLQAARAADVAISQFRFLKKLLLVHGTWSYTRLSKLILCT